MRLSTLLRNTCALAALTLLSACGGDGDKSLTAVDQITIPAGGDAVVVTLAGAGTSRTELELSALTGRPTINLVLELAVPSTGGDAVPTNGLSLNVMPAGLAFSPPANMRQALVPAPVGQHYVAISIPVSASTWTVRGPARKSSFHDPSATATVRNGTEVWEIDVTGSGRWAFALAPDLLPDGGPKASIDGGDREAGVADGGRVGGLLDGALRVDAGAAADAISIVDMAIDSAGSETSGGGVTADAPAGADEAPVTSVGPDATVDLGAGPAAPDVIDLQASDVLIATPTALSFGAVAVGSQSAAITVTVTNFGSTIAKTTATVSGTGFVIAANTCADTLVAGTSCRIAVQLSPAHIGSMQGSLYIGTNLVVSLSGTATDVGLNPTDLALALTAPTVPTTKVGSTMVSPVALTFNGSVAGLSCTVSAPSFTVQMGTCASSYTSAGSCALALTFAPTATGTMNGSLDCSATGGQKTSVTITGTAVAPHVTLSGTAVSFGDVATGATATATSISLHNEGAGATGTLALTLSETSASAFAYTSTCAGTLAAGASCTIAPTFSPTSVGSASATLTVSDGSASWVISLSGIGVEPTPAPALTVSLASIDFGTVQPGTTSSPTSITIRNYGTATAGMLTFAITGAAASSFAVASTCTSALAAGAACTAALTFKPTGSGSASATLTVSGGGATATVFLSGTGADVASAHLAISPASIDFGNVSVGTRSTSTIVTVTNSGTATASGLAFTLTGASASSFTVDSKCAATLSAGGSCMAAVFFRPVSAEAASATLTMAGSGPTATVSLSATGTNTPIPQLTISPSPANFGNVAVGTSLAISLTVTNSGNAATGAISMTLGGTAASAFRWTSTCSQSGLAPGETCLALVTFQPLNKGAASAFLTVVGGTASATATLVGTGTDALAPRLTISPNPVAFGNVAMGNASSTTLTVTNSGTAATGTVSASFVGASSSLFAYRSNCSSSLEPNGTCTIAVTFSPTVVGSASASLIVGNKTVSATVDLTGNGTAAPKLVTTPTTVGFGSVTVGTASGPASVTVTNTGTASTGALTVTLTGASASVFSLTTTCGPALAAAASCIVAVTCSPTATGTLAATLTIGDGSVSASVPLSASAIQAAQLTLTPASIDFGAVAAGSTATRTITIANTGVAPTGAVTIYLSGLDASLFAIRATTCTTPLAPNQMCTVTLGYAPTTAASNSATLTVTDGNTSTTASLTGTAGLTSAWTEAAAARPASAHATTGGSRTKHS
jgi:hypothetical protein